MIQTNVVGSNTAVADALARILGKNSKSSVLSKKQICYRLENGLISIESLKELTRLGECDINKKELFMLDVVVHTKHYHDKVYLSKVSSLLIIMDGATGLVYRVNRKDYKYGVNKRGIFLRCIKYATPGPSICIYSVKNGFNDYNIELCEVSSGITNNKENDYWEIPFTDKAFYGNVKVKVHILIAALDEEVKYKIILAMDAYAEYVIHHKSGKFFNLSVYLRFMLADEHRRLPKADRTISQESNRVANCLRLEREALKTQIRAQIKIDKAQKLVDKRQAKVNLGVLTTI